MEGDLGGCLFLLIDEDFCKAGLHGVDTNMS